MGFISAPTNLASPSAIGSTTPNTGAFTTLDASNGTLTSSTPAFTLSQTWNSAGVTFTALRANVTDTASASGSLLMDLQVGGSSKFYVQKDGNTYITNSGGALLIGSGVGNRVGFLRSGGALALLVSDSTQVVNFNGTTWTLMSSAVISWSSGNISIANESSAVLAQRNSTNAQTFRLYRTYTDASNYERLGFLTTNTTRYTITSQNAGTGSARSLEVSFYTSASDPTSTDITSGCFSVWKNSGTGTIKLWANDGGTMKSVALA